MKEEAKEGMSQIKKTIIGIVTTAVTAAGAYVTTHINQIFGVEEESTVEQVDQISSNQVEQKSEQNVNVQGPTINLTIPQQQVQQTRVIERVIEKPAAAPAPIKEIENEDPW
jgi:hypothetical protein